MIINPKYHIGQIVYLLTDPEQQKHIVTAYIVHEKEILYEISFKGTCNNFYDFELTDQPDIKTKLNI